jgi:uncharacterized protein (DUF4415 family)
MKKSMDKLKAELAALDAIGDEEINYEDIPSQQVHPERLRQGNVGRLYKPLKVQKTLRLDADVLDHFESTGKGYQTRINAVLREAMLSSEPVLEEVRKNVETGRFENAARLVRTMTKLRPETKPYIGGRVRAMVLTALLKPSADDYRKLAAVLGTNPKWWRELEEQAGEPSLFPAAVGTAIENIRGLLRQKSESAHQM